MTPMLALAGVEVLVGIGFSVFFSLVQAPRKSAATRRAGMAAFIVLSPMAGAAWPTRAGSVSSKSAQGIMSRRAGGLHGVGAGSGRGRGRPRGFVPMNWAAPTIRRNRMTAVQLQSVLLPHTPPAAARPGAPSDEE